MVSEHKIYKMREKAQDDKLQARISAKGEILPTKAQTLQETFTTNLNMQVNCPFCLCKEKLQKFLVSTAKGISQSRAECPECHITMRMSSLTAEMTPEQYARWVFDYRANGFWQKCKYAVWKKRLVEYGWASQFWEMYKKLRGQDETGDFMEHMDLQEAQDREKWIQNQANAYDSEKGEERI